MATQSDKVFKKSPVSLRYRTFKFGGIVLSVKLDVGENHIVAYISGEIDHHNAKNLRDAIDSMAERTSPKVLVLDFRGVTFMDSSGIGLVMGRYKLMSSLGGVLEIANVNSHIKKVMKISGLDKFAKIREER